MSIMRFPCDQAWAGVFPLLEKGGPTVGFHDAEERWESEGGRLFEGVHQEETVAPLARRVSPARKPRQHLERHRGVHEVRRGFGPRKRASRYKIARCRGRAYAG